MSRVTDSVPMEQPKNGVVGNIWNAQQYIDNASFVADYGLPVLGLLNPQPGEKILDLGCGDGALTEKIAAASASGMNDTTQVKCEVYGIDSSESMISKALSRGLSAEVMNATSITFTGCFDAVFSNATLHWVNDPDACIRGVAKALKPKARFVAEFGGYNNVNHILMAIQTVFARHQPDFGQFNNPWYFPTTEDYQKKLESGGFNVTYIELIPRPTPLNCGVRAWLETFANGIVQHLTDTQKSIFFDEVVEIVRPHLYCQEKDLWMADYVRLRFRATKL